MAVVKANYVKRGIDAKNRAKATIRYNQQRPGKDKERVTRDLFGSDGTLTRQQVYKMIDKAIKGTYFYRIVISPDPSIEDGPRDMDLKELTVQTIASLEQRLKTGIPFAAFFHADHSPHRHVHVLALINKKLSQKDLDALRESATKISSIQRRIRDRAPERAPTQKHTPRLKTQLASKPVGRGVVRRKASAGIGVAPAKTEVACPRGCGGYAQTMKRLSSKIQRCESCGIVVRKDGLEDQIERPGLFLSRGVSTF
jgi:ribosomal protein L37AE/L43A